jgi:UDP-GlcNAc3NAcA epimerase
VKILTVVGARPQFIKAAAVSRVLRERPGVEEVLVHTGQHYDENLSEIFFRELEVPQPRHQLGVGSGRHGAQTGRMLEMIEEVLCGERPSLLLVYGDTNSTLAGALAAAKMHVPVAHVEAGLRSFNRRMPEEVNRVLTDHVSRWLFAPTEAAVSCLRREGVADGVHLVGDVMYDAALRFGRTDAGAVLERLGVRSGEYVLATVHRAENTDESAPLANIFNGLREAARWTPIVAPLHPRTSAALRRDGLFDACAHDVRLIDAVGYLDMMRLERHARLVVTDSGGVQREAYFHRIPCVILRPETEWVELVELGWSRLAPPTDAAAVRDAILAALAERPCGEHCLETPPDLYGGGWAAQRIADVLCAAA